MIPAVAIFGGTFDPIHYGHLRAAAEVAEKLDVPDFRLVPARQPPHRDETWATPRHRLAMLELALSNCPDLAVDDREIRRGGPSYMVDTLASLRVEQPDSPILVCLGQDAANLLTTWHNWRGMFEFGHLVVMTRPKSRPRYPKDLAEFLRDRRVRRASDLARQPAGRVCHVEVTRLAISSTDIRNRIAAGKDPRFLLPDNVLSYIRQHRLYGSG